MARPHEKRPFARSEKEQLKRMLDRLRNINPPGNKEDEVLNRGHRKLTEATKIRAVARGFFDLAFFLRQEGKEEKKGRTGTDPENPLGRLLNVEPWEGEDERVFLRWKALLLDGMHDLFLHQKKERPRGSFGEHPPENEAQLVHLRILLIENERRSVGNERAEERYQLQRLLAFEGYYHRTVRHLTQRLTEAEVNRKTRGEQGRMDLERDHEKGPRLPKPIRVGEKHLLVQVPQYRKRRGLYRPWRDPLMYTRLKRLRGIDEQMIRAIAGGDGIAFLHGIRKRVREQGYCFFSPIFLGSFEQDLFPQNRTSLETPRLHGILIDERFTRSEKRLLVFGVDLVGDLGLISTYPGKEGGDGRVGEALEDLRRRGLQKSGGHFFIFIFGPFPFSPKLPEGFEGARVIKG